MELNRDQIIKALECWASGNPCEGSCCPLFEISPDTCDRWIGRNALALIKELTEDVERVSKQCGEIIIECDERDAERLKEVADWKAIAEGYQKQFEDCAEDRAKLTEENERLHASCTELEQVCKKWQGQLNIECEYTRADTVRKMQERLKAQKFTHKNFGELVYVEDIDQIAKEMVEGATHTNNANTCICCGEIIPEGTLTCPKCNEEEKI